MESRADALKRGRRLERFTIGWNALEAVVSIVAAYLAGSTAQLGFGVDSLIESGSGAALLCRCGVPSGAAERLEETAGRRSPG